MNQTNFNKILLQDTGIYNSNYTFCSTFKKNNITLLSQVLDDDLMADVMLQCKSFTRRQLMGFISLIKFKYLNIPMVSIGMLDGYCEDELYELNDLGCNESDINYIFKKICRIERSTELEADKLCEYKLVDILKTILPYCKERTSNIIKVILDGYKQYKDEFIDKSSNEILQILKEQMEALSLMRDSLDVQINTLKEQIELLQNGQFRDGGR